MMFLAPVKTMAILKTRSRISMTTVLKTATATDQMEKVKGVHLCTMLTQRETTMKKKKNQVSLYGLQICLENLGRRRT